ncbi:hypothetical protein SY83_03065 [Paenibacillus swuensis]|uniref:Glycosyl hydrolase family 88 n=1 Tax=Paenibacillus swuensis TaxID=1178515 RepID=A0A172TEJ1_9BACL|nr:glycoside hydrolase family 88 protein [Paenibacillus swuensis]ANE45469.1 hypothetical protein SY83_03065 [Paenibacillus swuensis]
MNANVMQPADLQESANRVWEKMSKPHEEWNFNLHYWEWETGVGLMGMIKAYETSENADMLEYIKNWAAENKGKRRFYSVNWVAPANVLLFMHRLTGEEEYIEACREYSDWCVHQALRTSNGGFAHVWKGGQEDYKNQLWIDTLFMSGIFMLDMGVYDNDQACLEEGLRQFDIHIESQFDPSCDLFYHGYHCLEQKPLGQHWGRGNGWAAVSLVELLRIVATSSSSYDLSRYEEMFTRLMNSAYDLRMEDGMLRTLLDVQEEASYVEVSASALFAYAAIRGVKQGLLEPKFMAWAQQIVASITRDHLEEDGTILHASGGTDCQTQEGYFAVPYFPMQYTYGIVLMLLNESLHEEGSQ